MEWNTTTHLYQIELAPHSDLLQAPGHEGPGLSEVFFSVFWEEHRKGRLVRQAARVLILPALGYRPVVDALMIPGLVLPVPLVLIHHHVIFGAVCHPCLIPHCTLPDLGSRTALNIKLDSSCWNHQLLDDQDTHASASALRSPARWESLETESGGRGGERGRARAGGRSSGGRGARLVHNPPTHPADLRRTRQGPWLRHRFRLPSRRRRWKSGC